MEKRGRGRARRGRITVETSEPKKTEHPWLHFSETIQAICRDVYISRLSRYRSREIESGMSFDWEEDATYPLLEEISVLSRVSVGSLRGSRFEIDLGWEALFQMSEPVYRELTLEFFSTYTFRHESGDYGNPSLITFRLGGQDRRMSLFEFSWRLGIYPIEATEDPAFRAYLSRAIRGPPLEFAPGVYWRYIANGEYDPTTARERDFRCPTHRLLHRLITSSVCHRHEQSSMMEHDLFYMFCLTSAGVSCNLPYAIALFLSDRAAPVDVDTPLGGGHFVTRLARSFYIIPGDHESSMMRHEVRLMSRSFLEEIEVIGTVPGEQLVGMMPKKARLDNWVEGKGSAKTMKKPEEIVKKEIEDTAAEDREEELLQQIEDLEDKVEELEERILELQEALEERQGRGRSTSASSEDSWI